MRPVPGGKRNQSYVESDRQDCMHCLLSGFGISSRLAVRRMQTWHICSGPGLDGLHGLCGGMVRDGVWCNHAGSLPAVRGGQVLGRRRAGLHRLSSWQVRDGRGVVSLRFVQ